MLNRKLEPKLPLTGKKEEDSSPEDEVLYEKLNLPTKSFRPSSAKAAEILKQKRQTNPNHPPINLKRNQTRNLVDSSVLTRLKPRRITMDKERLYEENMALKLKNNNLLQEILKLRTKVAQVEKDLAKKEDQTETSQFSKPAHMINNLKSTVKELKSELTLRDEEIHRLRKNIKSTKINEIELEVQAYIDECTRLRHHLEEIMRQKSTPPASQMQIDDKSMQNTFLSNNVKKENEELGQALSQANSEIARLKGRVKELEKEKKKNGVKKSEVSQAKNENLKLKSKVEHYVRELAEKEDGFKEELSRVKRSLNEAYGKVNNFESKVRDLICENEEKERQIKFLQESKMLAGKVEKKVEVKQKEIEVVKDSRVKEMEKIKEVDRSKERENGKVVEKEKVKDVEKAVEVEKSNEKEIRKENLKVTEEVEEYSEEELKVQNTAENPTSEHVKDTAKVHSVKKDSVDYEEFQDDFEDYEEQFEVVQPDPKPTKDPEIKSESEIKQDPEPKKDKETKLESDVKPPQSDLKDADAAPKSKEKKRKKSNKRKGSKSTEKKPKELENLLTHLSLRMQINRIPKSKLYLTLFKAAVPDKPLTKPELSAIMQKPPLSFTQAESDNLVSNLIDSSKSTTKAVEEKIIKFTEDWEIFNPEEEEQFDEIIGETILSFKDKLLEQCKKKDSEGDGTMTLSDFKKILSQLGIKLPEKVVKYMQLLFYSHNMKVDQVPYFNFIKAYTEQGDEEMLDEEKAKVARQYLGIMAQILIQNKKTVFDVFECDENGIIGPNEFFAGLHRMGLEEIQEEHVMILLEALQFDQAEEVCVHIEEFEEILNHYGVEKEEEEDEEGKHQKKVSMLDSENYELSEDSPEKQTKGRSDKGLSESSPFGKNKSLGGAGHSSGEEDEDF